MRNINLVMMWAAFFGLPIVSTIMCAKSGGSQASDSNSATACSPNLIGGRTTCSLTLMGNVTTIAGPAPGASTSGDADGVQHVARFSVPYHAAATGTHLFLADLSNNKIRRLTIADNAVTTIAGPAVGATTSGDTDGTGTSARFSAPRGITTDGSDIYVADGNNHKIRKIVIASGIVTTFAGPAQGTVTSGDTDGVGNAARFNLPFGITMDATNLYVADRSNHKIRKIALSTGAVTTLAGPAPGVVASGDTDGIGNAARFNQPNALTTDGTYLYVADLTNHKIRKIEISTGNVSTLAGPASGTIIQGDTDGVGTVARFSAPAGITTDGTNLYVTDGSSNKVRRIVIATGAVSTLAGPAQGSGVAGDIDGAGNSARFSFPVGVTTDGSSLFVTEFTNNKIRRIR